MLIAQVVKKGWYIDYKVKDIDDIPIRYVIHVKTIGYEKYGTDCVSYIELRLQGMDSSDFRGSGRVFKFREGKGKGSNRGNRGGTHGSALRFIRGSSPRSFERRGDMVRRGTGVYHFMVSPGSETEKGVSMVNQLRLVKLDIDVDIQYYEPEWLLSQKVRLVESLGYEVERAWWEISPSGRHIHILIMLKRPLTVKELFDLQFILGDDPKRSEYNYLRYSVMGEDAIHFNVLYAYKKPFTLSDKLRAILRHWFKSLQYSKKRKGEHIT
jgi:hypothetical protein